MPAARSNDGRMLCPWVIDDISKTWDTYKPAKLRVFSLGKSGSKPKAAKRLSLILLDNAEWLGGSPKTDIEVLYDNFDSKLIAALKYLEWVGLQTASEQLGLAAPLNINMGFWSFCRPSLQHIHHLACLHWGRDPVEALETDKKRRSEKATILAEWKAELNAHLHRLAYSSSSDDLSNARLKAAINKAKRVMAEAEDAVHQRQTVQDKDAFRRYESDYIEATSAEKPQIQQRWRDGYYHQLRP